MCNAEIVYLGVTWSKTPVLPVPGRTQGFWQVSHQNSEAVARSHTAIVPLCAQADVLRSPFAEICLTIKSCRSLLSHWNYVIYSSQETDSVSVTFPRKLSQSQPHSHVQSLSLRVSANGTKTSVFTQPLKLLCFSTVHWHLPWIGSS